MFELFIGGRVEEAKPLLDPDIDWIEPEEAPDRRVVKGADAALAALRDWLDTWSAYEVEVLEMVETPADRVFVTMRQRATGAVSGVPSEGELFQVWTFSDGRPVRMEFFFDREKAVVAAGLA